ncbi:MAG TPA: NYN domain-containing protein [Candidatus Nanoarchaeia archaeon]|nr:NYN domain-containing protein [Candidatus Nanoarchaeia archaeon]
MPRVIDYKGQRVGVFVDVQNMYYSAKNVYGKKVNFANILRTARGERTLIRAIAYGIRAEATKEHTFFDALEAIGFEVKVKDIQIFAGGAKKGDWDIGIAMDAIETAPKLDVIVLISGDGDFVPLVEHLRRALGCKVEVMSFGKSTAGKLKESADVFTDMDADSRKYLIGKDAV